MPVDVILTLEIMLCALGFGLCIILCKAVCKACCLSREEQIEREAQRRNEQDGHPHSIYFIPFPGNISRQNSEDHLSVPRYSQEVHSPPQYNTAACCGPPPSYDELGFKPEDLPPTYSEYNVPVYPITPPPYSDMGQPQPQSSL
uniref:developmental and secondary metabolism regulator veA-like n=1 Tax=Scatophagus argus TaxID=75038 RepID=UPI001ED84902|nr:developmental and secondary metabolism regulator veA-like [Scatophagus argus]